LSYRGYYINLDRAVTRRNHIEAQLARYGLEQRYERFAGCDGNALGLPGTTLSEGEIGCFSSHYLLLKTNIAADTHLHVVEDDAIFHKDSAWAIDALVGSGIFDQYDILFTEQLVYLGDCETLKGKYDEVMLKWTRDSLSFSLIDYTCCTSSYIVAPGSIRRVFDIFEESLATGVGVPIDILIRGKALEGKLRIACIFPFLTSILSSNVPERIIREERGVQTQLAYDLLRASFFIGRDMDSLTESAENILSGVKRDTHADLLTRIYRFALSGQMQPI
jgi:GR25 family glycosyltransferase involved in LPS biosynthesis